MWKWIKELVGSEEYLEWKDFAEHVGEMELQEFHERVRSHSERVRFEME